MPVQCLKTCARFSSVILRKFCVTLVTKERKGWSGMPGKARNGRSNAGPESQRKFKDARALQENLTDYFDDCDESGRLYSEQGMALYLGVSLSCLDQWWKGTKCPDLQETIRLAYLRIAEQICTDVRYNEKGMVSLKIFLLKQEKYGGYQDRIEARNDLTVNVKFGDNMEASDFQ